MSPWPPRLTGREDWLILRALSIYRLILAALLLSLQATGYTPNFFDHITPWLFRQACIVYVAVAVLLLLPPLIHRPRLKAQVYLHFWVDALAITTLVYACQGVESGMGVLLITPVAACSLILGLRGALFNAAIATLLIFAEELLRQYGHGLSGADSTATGILGLVFFAIAISCTTIARRARRSEASAQRARERLARQLQLNKHIVDTMQTGVIVVDSNGYVSLSNSAACSLLEVDAITGTTLEDTAPEVAAALERWRGGTQVEKEIGNVLPRFTALDVTPRKQARTLILLDDATQLRSRAQQLKLASLGQLTANIAHEIRNPLSAIGQAGQLLGEGTQLSEQDHRLLTVIERQGARIEKIVDDILSLSRSGSAQPESIALHPWLEHCTRLYAETHATQSRPIDTIGVVAGLHVCFDSHHLQRILFNLWNNSFEHGDRDGQPRVWLKAGTQADGRPWLDVGDNGPGIADDVVEHIFEPFFTTARSGTGLGLYIARELCEYNQARLQYQDRDGHACFRIVFTAHNPL